MARFSDRLAILITADAKGAIREINAVGDTSEKQFRRADSARDKWATGLTRGGAAAVGFAAVVGTALGKTVSAFNEADVVERKFLNTLDNAPQLAHANVQAFRDLADSIQDTTVVDDEAAKSLIALLGQFGATEDQIHSLTPLVVDLSRKMGIDLDAAGKAVGKTLDGNAGALRRLGILVDADKVKTDAFGATVDALSSAVGGFAEDEGKTFSGQLQILKNQLGEVAEGIGSGVVQAIEPAVSGLADLSDAFTGLDDGTQKAIGTFGTYATAAVGVVGATSFVAGQVLKMRDRFTTVVGTGAAATRTLNNFGKAAAFAGGAVAIGGAVFAAVQAIDALQGSSESAAEAVERLGKTTHDQLVNELEDVIDLFQESDGWIDPAAIALDKFNEVAAESPAQARRLIDAMETLGLDTEAYERALQKQIETQTAANRETGAAESAIGDLGTTTDSTAAKTDDYAEELADAKDKMRDLVDATLDAIGKTLDFESAVDDTESALGDYRSAMDEAKESNFQNKAAVEELDDATRDLKESILDQAESAVAAYEAQIGRTLTAKEKQDVLAGSVRSFADLFAPGSPMRIWINETAAALDNAVRDRSATVYIRPTVTEFTGTGGGGGVPLRAAGGPVTAGMPYIVGEKRPELFVPDVSGTILPRVPENWPERGDSGRGGIVFNNHYEVHDDLDLEQANRRLGLQVSMARGRV